MLLLTLFPPFPLVDWHQARRVLRIDPKTERVGFVGPELVGRCKWYGGVVGRSDGAIYGSELSKLEKMSWCWNSGADQACVWLR